MHASRHLEKYVFFAKLQQICMPRGYFGSFARHIPRATMAVLQNFLYAMMDTTARNLPTAAQTFAAFAASVHKTPLASDVVHHAKRAIIDWFSALMPGAVAAPATLLTRALAEEIGRGEARLAPSGRATARVAAHINATAAHTMEVDDIYREAIFHPGAPTIAAALALAQTRGATGLQLIQAVVAGYEVSTRVGVALGREHYRYWHNTGTVGTFGAAAAAASVLQLDAAACAHTLCTGATFAAGLQQAFKMDSMSKPLHAGNAAQAGVLAALAAGQGVTGSLDVLDGALGLGATMGQSQDWSSAMATLGSQFHITQMTFKNHACCGHTFAPIDGALALQACMGAAWQDIARIDVMTYGPALTVAGNPDPHTAAQARFSIPFVVATALIHGAVRLSAFTPERLRDAQIRALMARIHVSVDTELDANFPRQRAARLRFCLEDGRCVEYLQATRKGDPDDPLSDAQLSEKYMELVSPVIGAQHARHLLDTLWSLETQPQVRHLIPDGQA